MSDPHLLSLPASIHAAGMFGHVVLKFDATLNSVKSVLHSSDRVLDLASAGPCHVSGYGAPTMERGTLAAEGALHRIRIR
jgi:hypothetical protein